MRAVIEISGMENGLKQNKKELMKTAPAVSHS